MSILRTQEDNMVACQNYILDGSDISHFHILRWKKPAGLVEKNNSGIRVDDIFCKIQKHFIYFPCVRNCNLHDLEEITEN
jgi:hypothetical protein